MKMRKAVLSTAGLLLFASQVFAQSQNEDYERELAVREVELSMRLKEAEQQMAEAARQIAEITSERMPQFGQFGRRFEFSNKPRIGVTIDGTGEDGAVEGVKIAAVTPGSAADDVGLRTGDVITAINGEVMRADNSNQANKRLLDFMQGIEEGDELTLDYQRDGKTRSVELSPRKMDMHAFAWIPDGEQHSVIDKLHGMAMEPDLLNGFRMDFGFPWAGSSLGRMELVELSDGLGKYFGTDTGLLVVSAPEGDDIKLRDGDVIQSIDGRTPKDVSHAMRILGSYQSGETLKLGIMRDKKKRTLEIEIPAHRSSSLMPEVPRPIAPANTVAPLSGAPAEEVST